MEFSGMERPDNSKQNGETVAVTVGVFEVPTWRMSFMVPERYEQSILKSNSLLCWVERASRVAFGFF